MKTVQLVAVALEETKREAFDSQSKQIKSGKQATDPKDYVTLDQVVHEESKDLFWLEVTIPPEKQSKYINENRILMCADPKSGTLG